MACIGLLQINVDAEPFHAKTLFVQSLVLATEIFQISITNPTFMTITDILVVTGIPNNPVAYLH